MYEIDIMTRVANDKPFAIKTFKANDREDLSRVLSEQTKILRSKYVHSKQDVRGTLMQFKTNRGNLYAEIEVNRIQDS